MSVYSVKGKGWRYDFTLKGKRYTEAWFPTKTAAKQAEAQKREEIKQPTITQETQTDITFLELVNLRLDHVKAYNSERHYKEYFYMARRWVKLWGELSCEQLSADLVKNYLLERSKISNYTANKDLRYLKATFNYGIKRGYITSTPTTIFDFLPIEKRIKYIPSVSDIDKVFDHADEETQEYLWVIRETWRG